MENVRLSAWSVGQAKLPRGHAAVVIDYAENYSHKPRFEHQSKYFSQVQTTIIPVVLMLRIEDLTNITEAERAELLAVCDEHSLPHVISETHFVVSSDMQHDNAMIQKVFDDFIMPYIKANTTGVTEVHIRSDGCKAQFKCAANFFWVSRQSVEGCGLRVEWSFFESCHGKCYCDPEGGTLKNAAAHHELHVSESDARSEQLKDSEAFFVWASQKSGLATPKLSLRQKKGRGIYRRFFYWVPSKGTGAVNRSRLPGLEATGTSKLHEFVDIGVVGKLSTRRAACHQCDACWVGERHRCTHLAYTGAPSPLLITRKAAPPAAAAARTERAALNRAGVECAAAAAVGDVVCIETHESEQTFPWVIGEVVAASQPAPAASTPYDAARDSVHYEPVKAGEPALQVKLYEALQPGAATYTLSTAPALTLWVPARRVRVTDVKLVEVRASGRVAAQARNANVSASVLRYTIEPTSLLRIRAEMPTANDDWTVEKVLQYRCVYGTEQWFIKWQNYGDDRSTWEPWEHLLAPEVQAEARAVRTAALPRDASGLSKLLMVTLKAALEERGLETAGVKSVLVARLLVALVGES